MTKSVPLKTRVTDFPPPQSPLTPGLPRAFPRNSLAPPQWWDPTLPKRQDDNLFPSSYFQYRDAPHEVPSASGAREQDQSRPHPRPLPVSAGSDLPREQPPGQSVVEAEEQVPQSIAGRRAEGGPTRRPGEAGFSCRRAAAGGRGLSFSFRCRLANGIRMDQSTATRGLGGSLLKYY